MATFYGAWKYRDSFYGQRLILTLNRSGTTVSWSLQLESTGSMYANVAWSGWSSGSKQVSQGSGFTVTLASGSYTNAAAVSATVNSTMHWGGALSVSGSLSAAVAKPGAPSALKHARKAGVPRDGTLSWTAGARASDYGIQAVYDNQAWATKWYTSATSFPVANWQMDSLVWVRVFSRNVSGNSDYSNTITFYTPANKPAAPTLERSANGVIVKAAKNKYPYGLEYLRSDGVTGSAGSGTAALEPFQVTDTAPGGVGLTYQVRVFAGPESDRVYSAWSDASVPITTLATPNPPTVTAPVGTQGAGPVIFRWRHNSVDSSGQEAARLEYRLAGTTTWTPVNVSGDAQQATVNLAAGSYEYRVSTKGMAEDYSAPSAVLTTRVIAPPIVTITSPDPVVATSAVTVGWLTSQAEGVPQSAWRATLHSGAGVLETREGTGPAQSCTFGHKGEDGTDYWVTVETATSGVWSEPETVPFTVQFIPPMRPNIAVTWDDHEGCHYVTVSPGENLDGDLRPSTLLLDGGRVVADTTLWATRPTGIKQTGGVFSFDTTKAADDLVAVTDSQGRVFVGVMDLPAEPTVRMNIERSVDGGQTWEEVAASLPAQQLTIPDYEGLSGGMTLYRATAYTTLEASSETTVEVRTDSPRIWLAASDTGYQRPVGLLLAPAHTVTVSRAREVKHYSGRARGVVMNGRQQSRRVQGSAIIEQSMLIPTLESLEQIALAPSPHLYRDAFGRRIYGAFGEVPTAWQQTIRYGTETRSRWRVDFSLEEADR